MRKETKRKDAKLGEDVVKYIFMITRSRFIAQAKLSLCNKIHWNKARLHLNTPPFGNQDKR